jgi:hypothetical protein
MSPKIALRSLKNLCAFIGAVALFSYFYNFFVDLRHWHWHWERHPCPPTLFFRR